MERTLEEIASESGDFERLWVEEAARRYWQLRDGTANAIPSDEVFARLEARQR
ncbi:MAG: addiction module protein [Acidobacteria bacterium]|nr:addiction module protein [Acidobacteriota bacterium]MBV9070393.1 addiction module protein [Acidobacteriota bacterium]MBV9184732.1 addiction module protein [Acidobacteriota bacterium]